MKTVGVLFVAFVCVFGSLSALAQQEKKSTAAFRWLDEKRDSEVLAVLQKEYWAELTPGEQNTPRRHRRVGLIGNSAIVVVDSDRTEIVDGERRYDYFSTAYNFDFLTGKSTVISTTDAFWKWTLLKVSRFEMGPAPDLVFTYFDCVDCEATHILGSFRFDAESKEWGIRKWGKNEKGMNNEGIFIGSTTQDGDFIFRYATLFKVQDFDGDHFDDVMIWSREKAYNWENQKKLHSVKDTFVVFSIKAGKLSQLEPKGTARKNLQVLLCAGNTQHELCRAAKRPAVIR